MADAKIDWGKRPDNSRKRRYRILRGSYARKEPVEGDANGRKAFVHYTAGDRNEIIMTDREADAFPGGRKFLADLDDNGKLVRPSAEQIKYLEDQAKLAHNAGVKGKEGQKSPWATPPGDVAGE